MVQLVRSEIELDPSVLMAYAFFIESLVLQIGPPLLGDIESRCGIPREMLSVIGNHVQLDAHHTIEGAQEIERFLSQHPEKTPAFEAITRRTMYLFADFCSEVCEDRSPILAANL
jgi:hypothetical protein